MANFCEHCGTQLTEGVRFCEACGQPITPIVKQTSRLRSPNSSSPKSIRPVPSRKTNNLFVAGGLAVVLVAFIVIGLVWWHGQSPAKKAAITQKEVPAQKSAPSPAYQPPAPKPQAEPVPQPQAEPKAATGSFSLNEETLTSAPAKPSFTPPAPSAAPPPQATGSGRWPWTSGRLIQPDDLGQLSLLDLELMRNEIYARHGWVFNRRDLQDYFSKQPWYSPKGSPANREQANRWVQTDGFRQS